MKGTAAPIGPLLRRHFINPFQVETAGSGARHPVKRFAQRRQVVLAWGPQRRNRQDRRAVPIEIEHRRRLIDDRSCHPDVEVAKVRLLGSVEICVADIATASDRQTAVGQPQLVVHPARRTEGADRHLEAAAEAIGPRPARIE